MNKYFLSFLLFFLFSFYSLYCQVTRDVTVIASGNDTWLKSDGSMDSPSRAYHKVGGPTSGVDACGIYPFELPVLNTGESISSVNFSINLESINGTPQGHIDMYGIPYRNSDAIDTDGDYFQGDYDTDPGATALQDDFVTLASTAGIISNSLSANDNLVAFLNDQYDNGGVGGDFVFIRLGPDVADVSNYYYWRFSSANAAVKPTMVITIVDRPVTGVSIDQTGPITIAPGMTVKLTASVSPSNALDKAVSWSSSNNSIASVSSDGTVTAGSTESPATITVTTNDGGFTDDIQIIVDCSAVQTPANFAAMKGDREITLTWDAVNGADGYSIKFGTSLGGPYGTTVNVPNGATDNTVVTGLTNGTPYYFIITTVNDICESTPSPEATATPSDIYEYTGPNVYISTIESGNNLGQGMRAERIDGQPTNKKGFGSLIPLDFVIDIDAPNAVDDLNACLTFTYDPESLPEGMNLASLALYRFDDATQAWVKMGGYSDVVNNTVKLCDIDKFSYWTLAGSVPESVPLKNWGLVLIFIIGAGFIIMRKF